MIYAEAVISGKEDISLAPVEDGMLSAGLFGGTEPGPEVRKFADHVRQYKWTSPVNSL
jgi:hypothetical protein